MRDKKSYIFGPVPSRRLGLSLGVDIVPFKSCTQDCIYCQLGKTDDEQTIERKSFIPIDDVLSQLKAKLDEGVKADYITISGSGEPTLNMDIEKLIADIHRLTDIPVAVITNGTLLYMSEVRGALRDADLVVPSLDAVDQAGFEKINRPGKNIIFEKLIEGLKKFREEFAGRFWLEVFLVEGVNTDDDTLLKFKNLIEEIGSDKVQINTAVRPTAEQGLKPASKEVLEKAKQIIGAKAEVIADYSKIRKIRGDIVDGVERVFDMIERRPCSVDDIAAGLNICKNEVMKYITMLLEEKRIAEEVVNDKHYYKAINS